MYWRIKGYFVYNLQQQLLKASNPCISGFRTGSFGASRLWTVLLICLMGYIWLFSIIIKLTKQPLFLTSSTIQPKKKKKALFNKTDVFNKHMLETYPVHSIHFEFIMCLGMILFILFGCSIKGGGGVLHFHLSILP